MPPRPRPGIEIARDRHQAHCIRQPPGHEGGQSPAAAVSDQEDSPEAPCSSISAHGRHQARHHFRGIPARGPQGRRADRPPLQSEVAGSSQVQHRAGSLEGQIERQRHPGRWISRNAPPPVDPRGTVSVDEDDEEVPRGPAGREGPELEGAALQHQRRQAALHRERFGVTRGGRARRQSQRHEAVHHSRAEPARAAPAGRQAGLPSPPRRAASQFGCRVRHFEKPVTLGLTNRRKRRVLDPPRVPRISSKA